MVGRLVDWLVDWLVVGWLVDWLVVGWLVDWLGVLFCIGLCWLVSSCCFFGHSFVRCFLDCQVVRWCIWFDFLCFDD